MSKSENKKRIAWTRDRLLDLVERVASGKSIDLISKDLRRGWPALSYGLTANGLSVAGILALTKCGLSPEQITDKFWKDSKPRKAKTPAGNGHGQITREDFRRLESKIDSILQMWGGSNA